MVDTWRVADHEHFISFLTLFFPSEPSLFFPFRVHLGIIDHFKVQQWYSNNPWNLFNQSRCSEEPFLFKWKDSVTFDAVGAFLKKKKKKKNLSTQLNYSYLFYCLIDLNFQIQFIRKWCNTLAATRCRGNNHALHIETAHSVQLWACYHPKHLYVFKCHNWYRQATKFDSGRINQKVSKS